MNRIDGNFYEDGFRGNRGYVFVEDGRDAESGETLRLVEEKLAENVTMWVVVSDGGVWRLSPDNLDLAMRAIPASHHIAA